MADLSTKQLLGIINSQENIGGQDDSPNKMIQEESDDDG